MAGLKELLSKDYFGLPGWAYAVIVGGVGAALVFGPKLFGSQGTQTATDAGTTQANTGSTSGYTPVGPFAGSGLPVNDGQQSQTTADFAALQTQLQAIQNSLKPGSTVSNVANNPPSPQPVSSGTVHVSTTSQPHLTTAQQQAAVRTEQQRVLGLLGRGR